jgi:hypothetical protein
MPVAATSLAALALFQAASAAPYERVAQLGGGTFMFQSRIQDEVIADAQVKAEFDRLGLETACSIYNRSLDAVVETHSGAFTALLVAAMREHIPDEILASPSTLPGLNAGLISYRTRILRNLDQAAAPLYLRGRSELRATFLSAAGQAAGGGGAGIFEDWDLERPPARQVACFILSAKPERRAQLKVTFDGPYKRKDQR